MRKTQILINKLVYLGLSIIDLSKTVMYEFRYNYVKPKYDDTYKDIAEDIAKRFDTSNLRIRRAIS